MFPRLAEFGYEITSPDTGIYNCIAWAAQDQTAWWWPRASFYGPGVMGGSYWPETLPSGATISNFVEMFVQLGYENCETGDLEAGFEKVALYALRGSPTHAARQLPDGLWALHRSGCRWGRRVGGCVGVEVSR